VHPTNLQFELVQGSIAGLCDAAKVFFSCWIAASVVMVVNGLSMLELVSILRKHTPAGFCRTGNDKVETCDGILLTPRKARVGCDKAARMVKRVFIALIIVTCVSSPHRLPSSNVSCVCV
jgi:hypothetical protein